MPRLTLSLLAALAAAMVLGPRDRPARAAPPEGPTSRLTFQGSASCAAAACHNSNGPRNDPRSAYSTWAAFDPHVRAHDVLLNETSGRIIERLRKINPGEPSADKNVRCLTCHVLPELAHDPPRHKRFALSDGVACESCHGPAEKWLSRHYRSDWGALSAAEKTALGMVNLKDLPTRARLCSRCHVGSAEGDVNHDLIAAGHPRLSFELAAYHARLPKHWDVAKDQAGHDDFEVGLWALGQVTSARSAAALLQHRASTKSLPWPEFAEFDCFACHHDLADEAWRREPARVRGRPGAPGWGRWYFALTDVVAAPPPALTALSSHMSRLGADRARAAELAGALASWSPSERDAAALRRAIDRRAAEATPRTWDEAAQLYLALAARQQERKDPKYLLSLRQALEFPPGFDSPRRFDLARFGALLRRP